MIVVIDAFLGTLALYLILGLAFSIYFYLSGASKIDEGTRDTPWHFKLIIFPGVVLLWPSLFIKIFKRND